MMKIGLVVACGLVLSAVACTNAPPSNEGTNEDTGEVTSALARAATTSDGALTSTGTGCDGPLFKCVVYCSESLGKDKVGPYTVIECAADANAATWLAGAETCGRLTTSSYAFFPRCDPM